MCGDGILRALVRWHPRDAAVSDIGAQETLTRKQVLTALGKLMQRKLVERTNKGNGGNLKSIEPRYRATKAGIAYVKTGKRVTSGPTGPHAAPRKESQDTFRARLWRALRIQKKATIPELIEIARRASDAENLTSNAGVYLSRLARAGIVAKLPTREKGFALTSPGFARWALLRDLGPLAPSATAKHLVDPNAIGDARFIRYTEAT